MMRGREVPIGDIQIFNVMVRKRPEADTEKEILIVRKVRLENKADAQVFR